MMRTLIILHADGSRSIRPKNGVTLEDLQEAVGGYIEQLRGFTRFEGRACTAYCNEEGTLQDLPYNQQATDAWLEQNTRYAQPLVGPVVIEIKGNN